jgi:hypothetical protein
MLICQSRGRLVERSGLSFAWENNLSLLKYQGHSPIIGGTLSHPATRFPDTFGHNEFFRKYPYFLACAVPATFTAFAWLVTFLFLKEVSNCKCLGFLTY